jgi:hypothetical protein
LKGKWRVLSAGNHRRGEIIAAFTGDVAGNNARTSRSHEGHDAFLAQEDLVIFVLRDLQALG